MARLLRYLMEREPIDIIRDISGRINASSPEWLRHLIRRSGLPDLNPYLSGYPPRVRRLASPSRHLSQPDFDGIPIVKIPIGIMRDDENAVQVRNHIFGGNVFPITFGYPREALEAVKKTRLVSRIIPGDAYSFESEQEFRDEYASSHFALSPKKGGWDTFRHLEILFSDCTPLVPNLANCPEYTLANYPKKTLRFIYETFEDSPFVLDKKSKQFLQSWRTRHLSASSVARQILDAVPVKGKVFFWNVGNSIGPDYLSITVKCGAASLGHSLIDVVPTQDESYLFENLPRPELYGRGFGYVGALHGLSKPQTIDLGKLWREPALLSGATVVLTRGDRVSDFDFLLAIGKRISAVGGVPILLHGGDDPPNANWLNLAVRSGSKVFVRELDENFSA